MHGSGILEIEGRKEDHAGIRRAGLQRIRPTKKSATRTQGHAEVLQVEYDPKVIKLEKLLEVFFEMH